MREKIIVYGIGRYLQNYSHFLPVNTEIVAYADRNKATSLTGKQYKGINVLLPEELSNEGFDYIYVATSHIFENGITEDLIRNGVPIEKIRYLSRRVAFPNWEYHVDEEGIVVSDIGGIRIREISTCEKDILDEIFGKRIYSIDIKENSVVIDFGMNVAIASLFFSSNPNVEKVYGFEPFPDTYKSALNNIEISDNNISKKIITYNCAVSSFEGVQEIPVMTEYSGGRPTSSTRFNGKYERKEQICYRKASDVITEIINANPKSNIVLKVDTEGSEFEIFDSLKNETSLNRIDSIILEYHKDPTELEQLMREKGFRLIRSGNTELGMIYAIQV